MPGIEDLVRDSLRQRAEDVEPTPALWREVDRRIVRRQRFRLASWAVAGATAALAALVVVPGLFAPGDPALQILDRVPAAGVVPDTLVVDAGGVLELHDLASGEPLPLPEATELGPNTHPASELAVRPGSTRDDFAVVAVRGGDGQAPAYLEVARRSPASGDTPATTGVGSSVLPETADDPDFRPSVVWAPDTDTVAMTLPADADGARVVLWSSPELGELEAWDEPASSEGFLGTRGVDVVLERGAQLLAWVGSTTGDGDTSWLWIRRPDGSVVTQTLLAAGDGTFEPGYTEAPVLQGVLDLATSFRRGGVPGEPVYQLLDGPDGPVLEVSGGDLAGSTVRLGGLFGDVDPASLWLDALQDAAVVGDGEVTWLFAHDGDGNVAAPVRLDDGYARAALFGAAVPAQDTDADGGADPDVPRPERPEPDPADDPEPDDGAPGEPAPDGPEPGTELAEPVLIGSGRELRLVGADGERTLLTIPDEGESWIVGVAVRPGSTPDDLTAAVLTTAEGTWDLRELRVVDGEVDDQRFFEPFPPPYRPGEGSSAGEGLTVTGPLWSPDGDSLAWLEFGPDAATLQVVGWSDGPGTGQPATDNAAFALDETVAGGFALSDWVEAPDDGPGATVLRAASADFTPGWLAIPLVRQGDGAWAQDAGTTVQGRPSSDGTVAALAGGAGADVAWTVQATFDGPVLVGDPYGEAHTIALPDDLAPDDGVPFYWVLAVGDGAVVGSPDTEVAYHVGSEGGLRRLPGPAAHAAVVR